MTDKEKYKRLQNIIIRECIDARNRSKAALKAGNGDDSARYLDIYSVLADVIREANDFEFMDAFVEASRREASA